MTPQTGWLFIFVSICFLRVSVIMLDWYKYYFRQYLFSFSIICFYYCGFPSRLVFGRALLFFALTFLAVTTFVTLCSLRPYLSVQKLYCLFSSFPPFFETDAYFGLPVVHNKVLVMRISTSTLRFLSFSFTTLFFSFFFPFALSPVCHSSYTAFSFLFLLYIIHAITLIAK